MEDNRPILIIEKKMVQMGLEEHAPVYKLWEKKANEWLSGYINKKKLIINKSLGKFEFGEDIWLIKNLNLRLF